MSLTSTYHDESGVNPVTPPRRHRFAGRTLSGECVRVIVEQHGIDVVVQARRPEDVLLAEVQDEV
jgi:hypothetical protein